MNLILVGLDPKSEPEELPVQNLNVKVCVLWSIMPNTISIRILNLYVHRVQFSSVDLKLEVAY